MASRYNV